MKFQAAWLFMRFWVPETLGMQLGILFVLEGQKLFMHETQFCLLPTFSEQERIILLPS